MDITTKTQIESLLDESLEQDNHKADYKGPAKEFKFDPITSRIIPAAGSLFGNDVSASPLDPTPWAWTQIFNKLGTTVFKKSTKSLPSDYLLTLRPDQRAALLNDHLQATDSDWLVRSFDDKARAVLSDRYTTINNTDLLDLLRKVSQGTDQPHSLTKTSSVTPDSLNVRIIWKDIETGDNQRGNGSWGIGTYIRNGETGNRRGGVLPLVQRKSCQNSIVLDTSTAGYEFLHLGSQEAKTVLIKAAIADVLPFAAKLLDDLIKADEKSLPDFGDVIAGVCKRYGWSDDIKTKIAIGSEGRETLAGLVNGVTWCAHSVENPDTKSEFEIAGGAILVAPDSLFHQAASVGRDLR